jgi:3-oxoadipate enol-lactonase
VPEAWIEDQAGRVWYDVTGAGPGVMLLHPGGYDHRLWDRHVEPFAERFTVVRMDLRGSGRSEPAHMPFSVVDDVAAVAAAAGFDRIALVGVSFGGSIAVQVAVDRPEVVSALVPCASAVLGLEHSAERRAFSEKEEELVSAGELDEAIELGFRVWLHRMGDDPQADARIRAIAFENRAQLTLDDEMFLGPEVPAVEHLEDIRAPTLVIEAERDLPDMRTSANLMSARIPDARRVIVPNTDHLVNVRNPEEFNRVVLEFLESVLI